MATVRITNALRNSINNKIKDQFGTRKTAITKASLQSFEPLKDQYREDLLATILETYNMPQATYDAIPEGWCHRAGSLKATTLNNVRTGLLPKVDCTPSIKVPAEIYYQNENLHLEHPRLQPYATHALQLNDQLSAVDHEERKTLAEVGKLLVQCGTVAQALEVWPHFLELLPEDVVEEHKRPTEKRQKREISAVDTDTLTSAVVKAKMANAALLRS